MTLKTTLLQAGQRVAQSRRVRKVANTARIVAQSGPATEIARLCGRAGVAGAIIDGSMGGMQAAKALKDGKLDGVGAAKHVAAEAGCGFVTSSAGTAGTVAVYMITGTMGPVALVAGMGASMGSRWAFRKLVGDTMPAAEPEQPEAPAQPVKTEAAKTEAPKPPAAQTEAAKPVQKPVEKPVEKPASGVFEAIGPDTDD